MGPRVSPGIVFSVTEEAVFPIPSCSVVQVDHGVELGSSQFACHLSVIIILVGPWAIAVTIHVHVYYIYIIYMYN